MHSTACHWSGRTGVDGHPVLLKSTKNYGVNFGLILPFIGKAELDPAVATMMDDIAREGGDRVRVVAAHEANYWWALPPLSWFFSPVITTVTAEYSPGPASPPR